MKEILLAVFSLFSSLTLVLALVALGWFLVWKFFLSRFRFVRDLLGSRSESRTVAELKTGRSRAKKSRRE